MYTANCGPPSKPSNGDVLYCNGTVEGSKVIIVCQSGSELNFAMAVCDHHGNWEPNTSTLCQSEPAGIYYTNLEL